MMKFTILILLKILVFVNYLGTAQTQVNGTHFKKQADANFTDNNLIENIGSRRQSEGSSLFLNESSPLMSDEDIQKFPMIIVSGDSNSGDSNSGVLKIVANESTLLISSYANTGVHENNSEIENAEKPNMREELTISIKESGNFTSDEETGNRKNISEIENAERRNKNLISDVAPQGFPMIIASGNSQSGKFKIVANESIRLISSYANTGVRENDLEIEDAEDPNMKEEFTISIKQFGNLTSDEEIRNLKNISESENVENHNKSIEFPMFVITGVANFGYFKILRNESSGLISYAYMAVRENNSEVENVKNSSKSEELADFMKEPENLTSDEKTGSHNNISEIESVKNRSENVEFPMFTIFSASNSGTFSLYQNESIHLISYEDKGVGENNLEVENVDNRDKREELPILMKESGNLTSDERAGYLKNISEIENAENRNQSEESLAFIKESGNLTSDEDTRDRKNISEVANRSQSEKSLVFTKESGNFTSDEDHLDRKNISEFENAENRNESEEDPLFIWKTSKLRSDEYSGDHKNIYEIENLDKRHESEESLDFKKESGNLTSGEDTGDSRNISEVENRNQSRKSLTSIKDTENVTSAEDVGVPKYNFSQFENSGNVSHKKHRIHMTRKSNKTDEGMNAISKEDDDNSDESEEFLEYPINYRNLKPDEGFTKLFSILYGASQKYKEKYWNPANLLNDFHFDESIDDNKTIRNFDSQNRSEQQLPFDRDNNDFTFDEDKNSSAVSNFGRLNQEEKHLPLDQNYSDFNFSETIFGHNISSILHFTKYNLSDGNASLIPNSENLNQSNGNLLFINGNGDYILIERKNISKVSKNTNEGRNRSEYLLPLNMYRKLVLDGKVHHDENISKMLNIENHNESKGYLSFVNVYGDTFDKNKNFSVIANSLIELRNRSENISTIPNIVNETRNRSEEDVSHLDEHHEAFHEDDVDVDEDDVEMDDEDILEMLNSENYNETEEHFFFVNDSEDFLFDEEDRNNSAIPNFVVENHNRSEELTESRNAVPDDGIQNDDNISEITKSENHNESKEHLPSVNESGDFISDDAKNVSVIPNVVVENRNRSEKDVSHFKPPNKDFLGDRLHDDEDMLEMLNTENFNESEEHLPLVNDSGDFLFDEDKNISVIRNFVIENRNRSGNISTIPIFVIQNRNQSEEDMSHFIVFPDDEIHDDEDISEIMNFENRNLSAGENVPFIDDYGDFIFFDGKNFSVVRDFMIDNFNQSEDYPVPFNFLDNVVIAAVSVVGKHDENEDSEHVTKSLEALKSDNRSEAG